MFFFIYKSQNFLVNRCWVKRFLFLYMCWWRPILRPIKTDMLLINNSLDETFSFALISTKLWLLASIYMGNTSLNYLLPDKEKLCDVFGWQFLFLVREKKGGRQYVLFFFSYSFYYLQQSLSIILLLSNQIFHRIFIIRLVIFMR